MSSSEDGKQMFQLSKEKRKTKSTAESQVEQKGEYLLRL